MSHSSMHSLDSSDLIVQRLLLEFFKGSLKCFQQLQKSEIEALTWDNQKKFLDATVNSKILTKYPLNSKFCRLFCKKLIELLEPVHEVHDDLYSFLCSAMKTDEEETFCYRHYIIDEDLNKITTIRETNNMVINGTTGMRTWEAARMLADWVLSNKDIVRSKRILELGCGVGFTGITIAKFCNIDSVIMTDRHDDVLNTVLKNIEINFPNVKKLPEQDIFLFKTSGTSIGVRKLDWEDVVKFPSNIVPDILIGADIVYDPSIIRPLCNTIKSISERNNDLKIIIANVVRNEETIHQFLKTLGSMSFKWESITHSERYIEWDRSQKILLLSITYQNSKFK